MNAILYRLLRMLPRRWRKRVLIWAYLNGVLDQNAVDFWFTVFELREV